ncbi:HlyD family secretion protein [Lichenihabitans sp. Uapishka_5]|uniref:HlyD family secretion protein n=1 Tax=Lichenihabitans sp. Uapishka_5 TaxID=3037302 RepID=UPI0029E7CEC5|nr:HlyD family secretion protein [Lichenihabitans sp. Uapishka_5]MDX7953866.1 HlyD family secretion protein [Lichenihabitans sp. Uapishka_5]
MAESEQRRAAPSGPDAGDEPRRIFDVASTTPAGDKPADAPAPERPRPDPDERLQAGTPPPLVAADDDAPPSHRLRGALSTFAKSIATLAIILLALLASLLIWDFYVTAPWTRDGRVRVQVASVAPQVSGQVTDLRVRDNQFVHKGDTLYVIDKFDFQRTLSSAQAALRSRAADLQVKKVQAERRQRLSDLATTAEEQQQYVGNATQAQATFDAAQQDVDQANVNLLRTEVKSPVNGYVTNLLMRVGDYAHEGTSNISVIDADSYWIDGYFEETKMAHICLGDRAEAQLMGYRTPILGTVSTVTRGISVSDAAPSTQGLPNVDPVYTWVRLAQRVPVRIAITQVPDGVPLVSGMTATVTIRDPAPPSTDPWLVQRWNAVHQRLVDLVQHPQPHARCVPVMGGDAAVPNILEDYDLPPAQSPSQLNPGLAPSMTGQPRQDH